MFYSMFGFQRVGDSIWAAADLRTKGFLIGATAGRTTLNGEGLQHQDGHSHLHASTVPNCISYDPAFAFEVALIVRDGIRRMYENQESIFYYITVYNENYEQPPMPKGVEEGVLRGIYKFRAAENPGTLPRVHLFGSGPILRESLRAQGLLREKYHVAADVWSVTSYTQIYRDGLACSRWNRLHPTEPPRIPHIKKLMDGEPWPIVAASDYVKSNPFRVQAWCPSSFFSLGTDGFGRSDTREGLRRFFEIDAEHIAFAALTQLSRINQFDAARLPRVIKELGIDPEAPDPAVS
jgi:pyruvate dehydrogenase E1 component